MSPTTRTIIIAVVALGLLAVPTAAEEPKAPQPAKDTLNVDAALERSIERELRYDASLPFDHIDVRVTRGIAELRGRVDNMLARERAAKQAMAVRGVQSVVNLLRVIPRESLDDAVLSVNVARALQTNPATDAYEATPVVEDGRVTLNGWVDSWQERELAETVVMGVRGVKAVDNQLGIRHGEPRLAKEIEGEIEQAMRWDVFVDHALIDVKVEKDVAILEGTVGSAAEKWLAMAKARTNGINRVEADGLKVSREAREVDLRQDKFKNVADSAIATAVERALTQDPRVAGFTIDVDVTKGMVTLRGMVDNLRARRAAVSDAHNTVGVLGVLDHLKVRATKPRDDAALKKDIKEALARDPYVYQYPVELEVEDGVVTIRGETDSWLEYQRMDDIAAATTGVRDVKNRIKVFETSAMPLYPYLDRWALVRPLARTVRSAVLPGDDGALALRVREELYWSPFVDDESIDIAVRDGVAILSGSVSGMHERFQARREAYQAGAVLVQDDLRVSTLARPEGS